MSKIGEITLSADFFTTKQNLRKHSTVVSKTSKVGQKFKNLPKWSIFSNNSGIFFWCFWCFWSSVDVSSCRRLPHLMESVLVVQCWSNAAGTMSEHIGLYEKDTTPFRDNRFMQSKQLCLNQEPLKFQHAHFRAQALNIGTVTLVTCEWATEIYRNYETCLAIFCNNLTKFDQLWCFWSSLWDNLTVFFGKFWSI